MIRAQHGKIEELRSSSKKDNNDSDTAATSSTNVHLQMIEELKRDAAKDHEADLGLRQDVWKYVSQTCPAIFICHIIWWRPINYWITVI